MQRKQTRQWTAWAFLAPIAVYLLAFYALPLYRNLDLSLRHYTVRSFVQGERWGDTAWALQWAVRVWVPVGFALLMAAALAAALRCALILFRK